MKIEVSDLTSRNTIVDTTILPQYVSKAQETNSELYASYYLYDDSILKHIKTAGSVKGFLGKIYHGKYIKFDIDRDSSDELTLANARAFVDFIKDNFDLKDNNMQYYFSGRGYHIYIPNIFGFAHGTDLHKLVKFTLTSYFPQADDIYDKTRVFRVANTINLKTNLYKIRLTPEEFYEANVADIQALAKEPRDLHLPTTPAKEGEYQNKIISGPNSSKGIPKHVTTNTNIVTCMQRLYERGPIEGRRHTDLFRLLSAWRTQGLNTSACTTLGQNWSQLPPDEVKRAVNDVFTTPYRYSCSDSVMKEFCEPHCIFYRHKNYAPNILSAENMEADYSNFITTDYSDRLIQLGDIYPYTDFKLYPGELIIITADTGMGKSAWIQNLNVYIKKPTLFFTLEMHAGLLFRRFLQIAHNKTREELEEYYQQKDYVSLQDPIKHITAITSPPELSQLRKIISNIMPEIVVIDVLDGITVNGTTDDKHLGTIAIQLKEIANDLGIIIFAVHHINKESQYSGNVSLPSIKGASSITQKADKVLAITGKRDNPFRKITSLKARDEGPLNLLFKWDVATMRFHYVRT